MEKNKAIKDLDLNSPYHTQTKGNIKRNLSDCTIEKEKGTRILGAVYK